MLQDMKSTLKIKTIGDKENVSDVRDRMPIFDLWLEPNPLKCRIT